MIEARELRRAIFALSDLTNGAVDVDFALGLGLDDLQDWLADALEWREDCNRARK